LWRARRRAREEVGAAQRGASRKNLRMELQLRDQPVVIDADPVRLEQMLGNLLGNAMKFTLPGGEIRVSLEAGEEWAVMRVRDNGIGIPPGHLDKVFELFGQS